MMIDWTPAWVTSIVPAPRNTAMAIAIMATIASCQAPEPKK